MESDRWLTKGSGAAMRRRSVERGLGFGRGACSVGIALAGLAAVVPPFPAAADVVRDGRVGSAGPGAVDSIDDAGTIRHFIRESDGARSGNNLYHSFARMDLRSNEVAVYQGDAAIRNLITTITGGRSSIDGRIQSEIAGANLFLINPDGIDFGENARFELSGGLTVSTADTLIFANGDRVASGGAPPALLSVADPVGFGFLDAPASIRVRGSRIELARGKPLALIGGDLDLRGGRTDGGPAVLSARSGRIDLVSLASAGEVERTTSGLRITGAPRFGDITLADDIFVSSSGLGGSPIADFDRGILPAPGSGAIQVRADDLLIRDADIRSLTATDEAADPIEIALTGQLTIETVSSTRSSGIFADTGVRIAPGPGQNVISRTLQRDGNVVYERSVCEGVGTCGLDYQASGTAGSIRIQARDVVLRNGGKITSRSEFSGDAGNVEIDFEREMRVAGRRSADETSQITTNSGGNFGNPGTIRIRSDEGRLILADHGALVIENSSLGIPFDTPGRIEVEVRELDMSGNARIDTSTRRLGRGGTLDIRARDRITMRGRTDAENFTGITTFGQPGSTGAAGDIRIETANLFLLDGAEIAARPVGGTALGPPGNLVLEIGDRLVMRNGTISTQSGTTAAGGKVDLAVGGAMEMFRSLLETDVLVGQFNGGNITVRPGPRALVMKESKILAGTDAGRGGTIDIEAGLIVADPTSEIRSPANTGVEGEVLINGVEGNIVPEVVTMTTPSADASGLLREPCAARRPGASNRFIVDEARRFELDSGGYLGMPMGALLAEADAVASNAGARDAHAAGAEPGSDDADTARSAAIPGRPDASIELAQGAPDLPSSDCTF